MPCRSHFLMSGPYGLLNLNPSSALAMRGLFLAGADVDAREILRALRRFQLREMDDIDRRLAVGDEAFQRLGQRQFRIRMLQRHRPVRGRNRHRRPPVEPREFLLEKRRVAQRRGHQKEPRLRQRQQRHLPRHAALAVGVVMEFVHDHFLHVGRRAFAQRDVGEDFRGAAKDGRVAIDRGVAGAEADVVRAELAAERHELFIHQRLDRAGVNGAPALGDGLEMQRGGHERFARPGGRVQDDVLLLEQFQDGRFLRGIKLQPPSLHVIEKAPEQDIVAGFLLPRNQII